MVAGLRFGVYSFGFGHERLAKFSKLGSLLGYLFARVPPAVGLPEKTPKPQTPNLENYLKPLV